MKRRKSMGFLNRFVDALKLPKELDVALHFVNEAVLHKSFNTFLRNFLKYEVLKWRSPRRSLRRPKT